MTGQGIPEVIKAQTSSLLTAWDLFAAERSVSLCPTSLASDWRQVRAWLSRSPIQDLERIRDVLLWCYGQRPLKSSHRVGMYIRSLSRWAASADIGLIPRDPTASVKRPKLAQASSDEVIVIPVSETQIVIDGMRPRRPGQTPWHLWVDFQLQTGLRTGEVRALRWDDIHDDKATIHANFTLTHGLKSSTKTNRVRTVQLNAKAMAILDQLPRNSEYLFPWNREAFQSLFERRMHNLHSQGLISHKYRPYDLRHTAISRWLSTDVPLALAARWAGNTRDVLVKHYLGVTEEQPMPVL